MSLFQECKEKQQHIVNLRRELHSVAETGLSLPETSAAVVRELDRCGIEYECCENSTGIIAYINKGCEGKCILLRTEMDALPINEENKCDYASKHEGKMHACGHDADTAMLLGAAEILNLHRCDLNGEIRLVFQTAEEISKGGELMTKRGAADGVDAAFAIHIGTFFGTDIPQGTFICTPGPTMAFFDRFKITVKGKDCHGSTPEKGIDPINVAAHIILGLEGIAAREINANIPCVISAGQIHGGSAYNTVPGEVEIEGTTRGFDNTVRDYILTRIEEMSQKTAEAYGASTEIEIDKGAPPVINDASLSSLAAEAIEEIVSEENIVKKLPYPNMGGDDFSCFLEKVPGVYMGLSSSNHSKGTDKAHHTKDFEIDEDVMWLGSAAFVNITEKFLND